MFSAKQRAQQIGHLSHHEFDVVVIGGGITGAGIALDAVSRGMSVALIDMQDFAAGTSSRSTKLVHGGLRYLKNFQLKIVAEVGREREIVYENGAHITEPKRMLLPFYQGGTLGPVFMNLGLRVYDVLANVKKAERRTMLSPYQTVSKEPLLKEPGLVGGGYYVEYRTDDARLTLETMKKAAELGAVCLNYAKAEGFIYEDGKVAGVQAVDLIDNLPMDIFAKKVVNATGPWIDEVQDYDAETPEKKIRLTKGVHIVVDHKKFPLRQAVYFDTPDKRMVFAVPRDNKVYVGTTDDFYDDNPISPAAEKKDVDYLIQAVGRTFPSIQLTPDDVEATWAGVRPLIYEEGKDPSDISRKDEIWLSENGLISIAGGKLTGYRKMAETVVDLVVKKLRHETGIKYGDSVTKKLPLSGGDFGGSKNFAKFVHHMALRSQKYGLGPEQGRMYAQFFGTNAEKVFWHYRNLPQNNPEGLPKTLVAVVEYAMDEEMARTPSDFFVRRTGDLYFHIDDVVRYREGVLDYMSRVLRYTPEQKEAYRQELQDEIEEATRFGRKAL
ncbi:glycerol-3-phosphate dehydrogenase/oxidase [Planococcus sp. YIM B11945]|uniref:glycerol-3-phosphate dehydrogenase/oxidase n=1 Tax=Planococcus sp. YIM B11945 TaxID=3435410 RepID=UPI003D7E8AEC